MSKILQKLGEARKKPESAAKPIIYKEHLDGISGYLGSIPDADTISARLNSLYGNSFNFKSDSNNTIKLKILHSLANCVVRKNLEKPYLSVLQGEQNLRYRDVQKLCKLGLVSPSVKGFWWEPINKLSMRCLELVLTDYAIETKIPMEDALKELRDSYTKKPTQTEEMIEADIKKQLIQIEKKQDISKR